MFPPNWCMDLTGVGAVKKPSATRLGDILREAADTVLHVSPPFRPLLLLPQHAEGDFFPIPPRPGRCVVLGVCLAGGQKVALQARCEAVAGPVGVCVFPRVGKA